MDVPLGIKYYSTTELTKATNAWILDPYQYKITQFDFKIPGKELSLKDHTQDPGLNYNITGDLRCTNTAVKRSEKDITALSYHQFLSNDGYFNPQQDVFHDSELWYYGASDIRNKTGIAGPQLTPQRLEHIIFPEAQRGGLNTTILSKYSTVNKPEVISKISWENQNAKVVNNDVCRFFKFPRQERSVYDFDSNLIRSMDIGDGTMPSK
jgi:hypothetical protein